MSGAAPPPDAAQLLRDSDWLAHRYDPGHDAVQFVAATRAQRSAAAFLTDADLSPGAPQVLARVEAVALAPLAAPIHFIFHSAYCCSTLLARAFDVAGVASALKEPQILNDLVGWRHRGGTPDSIRRVLDGALALLARPFAPGEAVVVKPSNVVNGLAGAMLDLRPEARALLLHAPLRDFVASIARKGMPGRLWVRELLSKQLRDGYVRLGFEAGDYFLQTDLQVAAVGWLAQQALFGQIAARWPDRVRTLDSETLVARPREALGALAAFYGLTLDAAQIDAIVTAEFARDAKDGSRFAPGQRSSLREAGASLHADEVEKVLVWAAAVAAGAGVSLSLPGALLAD